MIVNIFANLFVIFGITFFVMSILRTKSRIVKRVTNYEKIMMKFSLILISLGSISDLLIYPNSIFSGIISNIGFGIFFVWLGMFNRKYFTEKEKKQQN